MFYNTFLLYILNARRDAREDQGWILKILDIRDRCSPGCAWSLHIGGDTRTRRYSNVASEEVVGSQWMVRRNAAIITNGVATTHHHYITHSSGRTVDTECQNVEYIRDGENLSGVWKKELLELRCVSSIWD